jgi:hypothetical protein
MSKKLNGVYAWKVNGLIRYIGSGKQLIKSRKSNHLSRLREGMHCEGLQKLYDELGEESFEFVIIEECRVKDLFEREKHYKDLYKDTIFNENDVVNFKKSIKTGLKAKRHKEKFSLIMSGENNPMNSKLSEGDVLLIKQMLKDGIRQGEIAEIFNISKSFVSSINTGKRWKYVNIEDKNKEAECTAIHTTSNATAIAL